MRFSKALEALIEGKCISRDEGVRGWKDSYIRLRTIEGAIVLMLVEDCDSRYSWTPSTEDLLADDWDSHDYDFDDYEE